jgi:hypothetical protein
VRNPSAHSVTPTPPKAVNLSLCDVQSEGLQHVQLEQASGNMSDGCGGYQDPGKNMGNGKITIEW